MITLRVADMKRPWTFPLLRGYIKQAMGRNRPILCLAPSYISFITSLPSIYGTDMVISVIMEISRYTFRMNPNKYLRQVNPLPPGL